MKRSFARSAAATFLAIGAYSFGAESSTGEQLPLACGVEQSAYKQTVLQSLLATADVACIPVPEAAANVLGDQVLVVTTDARCAAVFTVKVGTERMVILPELAGNIGDITNANALDGPQMINGAIAHLDEIDAYGRSISTNPDLQNLVGVARYIRTMTQAGCERLSG